MSDALIIAGRSFRSRLIVGTGKYKSFQETARALDASGAEMVTVAVRRVNLDRSKESLLDYIDPKKYFLLPNTALRKRSFTKCRSIFAGYHSS
jgi:thiazole synthase